MWQAVATCMSADPISDGNMKKDADEFLCHIRSAELRKVSREPDEQKTFITRQKKVVCDNTSFNVMSANKTKDEMKRFVAQMHQNFCQKDMQKRHCVAMKTMINDNATLINHAAPNAGQHWQKLRIGSRNPIVEQKNTLHEIFLDQAIDRII